MNRAVAILQTYREYRDRRFCWGESDCLGFAIACASAIGCGENLERRRAEYTYASKEDAQAALSANGWCGLDDLAASLWERIPPAQAQTGDWALVVNDDGDETLGVFVRDVIAAQTLVGVGIVPRNAARMAYRVA